MNTRQVLYEQLCDADHLLGAWLEMRAHIEQPDAVVTEYELGLASNLRYLAMRLAEERYQPPSHQAAPLSTGAAYAFARARLEDLIVQRATRNNIEPLVEPDFLDCSFGFRPWRDAQMAVERVLAYRASGDACVVLSQVYAGRGLIDEELALRAVAARVRDVRMLNLIRRWLQNGLLHITSASPANAGPDARFGNDLQRLLKEAASGPLSTAIAQLFDEAALRRYDDLPGYAPQGRRPVGDGELITADDAYGRCGQALKEAALQFGRDALLVAAASTLLSKTAGVSPRQLWQPKSVALTAAAVLANAASPPALRLLRTKLPTLGGGRAVLPTDPLAPLLLNIALHQFDQGLTGAGLHLVRYADIFLLATIDERHAEAAYHTAAERLRALRLSLHPHLTRIKRFDEGVEFIGYRFHERLLAAAPVTNEAAAWADLWRNSLGLFSNATSDLAAGANGLGARAKDRLSAGFKRIKRLIKRTHR